VRAALPAHGACGAEAARVLYADGHAFLDVRSSMELDTEGKLMPQLPGVVQVPFITFAKRIDAATGRKCVDKTPNAGFLAAAARALPDKSRGVVVVCSGAPSQGVLRADAAADALRAAGYARVVVLSRGYAVRSRRAPVSSSLNRSAHIAQESKASALYLHRAGLVAALHEQG
jgi:rhodanese-related sulfurtransferase